MAKRKVPPLDLADATRRPSTEQLETVMEGFAEQVRRKKAGSWLQKATKRLAALFGRRKRGS